MLRAFAGLTGQADSLEDVVYDSKRVIIGTAMSSEVEVLSRAISRLSESHRGSRDFTFVGVRRALREVVACFPVYRTYVTARGVSDSDRACVGSAIAAAQARNPATEPSIFRFLETVLLPSRGDGPDQPDPSALPYAARLEVARRFQQVHGPGAGQGCRRHRVLPVQRAALAQRGWRLFPSRSGARSTSFHAANLHRREHWPREMNATATHDTKRGEDARARTERPVGVAGEWREAVTAWTRLNRSCSHTRSAPAGARS